MLSKRYLKESEGDYAIALSYFEEYYSAYRYYLGKEPHFTFNDVDYFTVDCRADGLTEVIFYNKNNVELFSHLD